MQIDRVSQRVAQELPPLMSGRFRSLIQRKFASPAIGSGRAITGSVLWGDRSDFHFGPFWYQGFYNWRMIAAAVALCPPGGRIFEVGANVGTETVSFLDIVGSAGHVVAVEPLEANLSHLRKLQHGRTSLHIIEGVVSNRIGSVRFMEPPPTMSGVGFVTTDDRVGSNQDILTVEVASTTLDWIAQKHGDPTFVAIDAEGAEPSIIDGSHELIRRSAPAFFVEASPTTLKRQGESLASLWSRFDDAGYAVWEVGRFGLHDIDRGDVAVKGDWLAIQRSDYRLASRVHRSIRASAWTPPRWSKIGSRNLREQTSTM